MNCIRIAWSSLSTSRASPPRRAFSASPRLLRRARWPILPPAPACRSPLPCASQQVKFLQNMVHFKNRYLILEVIVDPNHEAGDTQPIVLSSFNVTKAIKDSIQLNFGECGLASSLSSFQVKYVNPVTKVCIIRASRDDHQKIWTAISMVRSIGRCPIFFNLLDLSGCIRACRRKALECEETKFEHYKLMYGDRVTPEIESSVKSNFERIKALEN